MMRTAAALLALAALPAEGAECSQRAYANNSYTICEADLTKDRLHLFHKDETGQTYGYFSAVDQALEAKGQQLGFAMNAGMYHDDRAPVGHYVENGVETQRIITNAGPGNFGLLPNGVFCLREGRADVFETLTFVDAAPDCIHATQSGPMLVIDGALHPRFLEDGTSRFIRNGVGTNADGTRAVFVISDNPVTFHEFGSFFRDALALPNALYFDGNISRLRAPDLDRTGSGFTALGPIIGVVEPAR